MLSGKYHAILLSPGFQNDAEYSMLLAVPCGRDVMDIIQQSSFLKDGFIKYLQDKQAAGIVNVPDPSTAQVGVLKFQMMNFIKT